MTLHNLDDEKRFVGEKAAEYVENGMIVGLGTGSTIAYTILKLGERIQSEKLNISGVTTSHRTSALAESVGIKMTNINAVKSIDLTIDGVDEFDPSFNGIKGGGGALLFEKIVANASKRNIWVADHTKAVQHLGAFPLPVEVLPFGYTHLLKCFKEEGLHPELRMDKDANETYLTDSGNYILDCHLGTITSGEELSQWLNNQTGVIENGLFLQTTDHIIVAKGDKITELTRGNRII